MNDFLDFKNPNKNEFSNVNYNDNDSNNMKKTICNPPTRCVEINELNEGEIQKKIDALNLQYDKHDNENKNQIFSFDIKNYIEGENNQGFSKVFKEEESINLNELLFKSVKKENKDTIEVPFLKENTNQNINIKSDDEVNKNIISISTNTNSIANYVQQETVERKPSNQINSHNNPQKISDLEVVNQDYYLKPFEEKIKERIDMMNRLIIEIEKNEESLIKFSEGYKRIGFNITDDELIFREYAPGAKSISLVII